MNDHRLPTKKSYKKKKNTKILCNLCLHFASQDGQDRKKQKENHATKVTKIAKTKRRKYGMKETKMKNFLRLSHLYLNKG